MNKNPVITMTAFNRPQYLAQVLSYLSRCSGIEKYTLLPCVDPSPQVQEIADIFKTFKACPCYPLINGGVLGNSANTLKALSQGFSHSDYVIHLEDDVLLASDALEMFEHCQRFGNDPLIFSVSAYRKSNINVDQRDMRSMNYTQWFSPWGWATWQDRWQEMRANWELTGWDIHLNENVRRGRFQIVPVLSRAQNIGAEGGTHVPNPLFHEQHHRVRHWAGDVEIKGRWMIR